MTDISKLPLALYKANLELQIRLGKLLQESGAQWLQRGQQLNNEGPQDFHAELQNLLSTGDWQKLATLSTTSFWHHMQRYFNNSQAQSAVEAQMGLARDLQDAVRIWQQQTAEALAELAPSASPGTAAWSSLLKPWEEMLQAGGQWAAMAEKSSAKKKRT